MVKKRRVLKVVILLIIPLVILYLGISQYLSWKFNSQPAAYYKNLADVTIKSLKFEGINYSITEGMIRPKDSNHKKISQLASFYQWIKEDPLFYSPDLDLKGFEEAVNFLDQQQNKLLVSIKQTNNVYPASFLKEMVKSAQLTDNFLAEPSDRLASLLIDQYQKTASAYQTEANSLVARLASNLPQPLDVILLNVATNNAILSDDIEKIAKNGSNLEEEINIREKCLRGNLCLRPANSFPKPDANSDENQSVVQDDILTPELVFNLSSQNLTDLQKQKKLRGIYQTKTPCFGLNEEDLSWPSHLFYLRQRQNEEQIPYVDILLATEIFFRKLVPYSEVAGDKELLKQGIKYTIIPTNNSYMCPYSGYLAEVATLDLFLNHQRSILEDRTIDTSLKFGDFFKRARKIEKDFFDSNYPSYQSLEKLAENYGYLYRLMVENPKDPGIKSLYKIKDKLLERYLAVKNKLGQINLLFNDATDLIEGANQRVELSIKDPILTDPAFIYTYKNFYGLYYLPFSASIWRSDESLQYIQERLVTGAVSPTGGWISYHQAIELYTSEKIQSWFTGRRDIFNGR